MLGDHVPHGHGKEVLELFHQLQFESAKPVEDALITAVKEATSSVLVYKHLPHSFFSCSSSLAAYIHCGNPHEMAGQGPTQDMDLWSAVFSKSVHYGLPVDALSFFGQTDAEGVKHHDVTYWSILKACGDLEALEQGMCIHGHIVESEPVADVYLGNTIMGMYSKCGALEEACTVFERMSNRDVMSWTVLILGLAQWGYLEEVIQRNFRMEAEGIRPNEAIWGSVLNACASITNLNLGRHIHNVIMRNGVDANMFLGNTLVDMYAKCGTMEDAERVFDSMAGRNVISWTSMITGYTLNGYAEKALKVFKEMDHDGVKPNMVTFLSALNACAHLGDVKFAKHIHACFSKSQIKPDISLMNTLVDMYAKCESIVDACEVFEKMLERNVVSWTTLIVACTKHGYFEEALGLFSKMQSEGVGPNDVTFTIVLGACAGLTDLEKGRQQHDLVIKKGLKLGPFLGSSLVNMYLKCGSLEEAKSVFDCMPERSLVSWNGMIAGYAQHGRMQEALDLFQNLKNQAGELDVVTLVTILNAAASSGNLTHGRWIHAQIACSKFELDGYVATALANMYGKCGSINDARQVFDRALSNNLILWTTIIAGYAQHGYCEEVFQLIDQLQKDGMKPNGVTFIGVLLACSHMGLVEAGKRFFSYMVNDMGIIPMVEHYVCLVDLLGRCGCLQEAEDVVANMPVKPTAAEWLALLSACRFHANVELATYSIHNILQTEPQKISCFVLLSNIHAASGNWGNDYGDLVNDIQTCVFY